MSRTRTALDSWRTRVIHLFFADGRSSGVMDRVHSMCTVIKIVPSQGCHGLAVGSGKTESDTPPSIMSFSLSLLSLKLRCVSHGRHSGPASWQLSVSRVIDMRCLASRRRALFLDSSYQHTLTAAYSRSICVRGHRFQQNTSRNRCSYVPRECGPTP